MINAVVALLLGGCVNTVRFPPDLWDFESTLFDSGLEPTPIDTGAATTPIDGVRISRVLELCGAETQQIEVITTGWASEITFDLLHVDGRSETHRLSVVAADPGGSWDQWEAELVRGVQKGPGVTGFDCLTDAKALSYAVRVTTDDEPLSDCGVWGVDPDQMNLWLQLNEPAYTGPCRPIDP